MRGGVCVFSVRYSVEGLESVSVLLLFWGLEGGGSIIRVVIGVGGEQLGEKKVNDVECNGHSGRGDDGFVLSVVLVLLVYAGLLRLLV